MKHYKDIPLFPIIRRNFKSIKELGEVINRSESYVGRCLNGRQPFSALEKRLILSRLGVQPTEANKRRHQRADSGGSGRRHI